MRIFLSIIFLTLANAFGAATIPTTAIPPRVQGLAVTTEWDVRWYGALFNNSANDQPSIQAAINACAVAGGGVVIMPQGTAKVNSQIVVSNGVTLLGSGKYATILDGTGIGSTTPLIYSSGTLTALPTLNTAIAVGDTNIIFASAHGLAVGDIINIINDNANSWGTFSGRNYRQGYWAKVTHVLNTTNVATVESAPCAIPTGANILCWKMTPTKVHLEGFGARFKSGNGANPTGCQISLSSDSIIRDVDFEGSQYGQIYIDRAYGGIFENLEMFDNQAIQSGNYGIVQGGVIYTKVRYPSGRTSGPLVAFGDAPNAGNVPNRYFTVELGNEGRTATSAGINVHGNAEFYQINGVTSQGIEIGGDEFEVNGGFSQNSNPNFQGINTGEMLGLNGTISNMRFKASHSFDNGFCTFLARDSYARKSTLRFNNCTFDGDTFSGSTYPSSGTTSLLRVGLVGTSANLDLTVVADACEFKTSVSTAGPYYGIFASTPSANGFYRLIANNCTFKGCGILGSGNVDTTIINNPIIENALQHGISIPVSTASFTNKVQIVGGNIQFSQFEGVNIIGQTNLTRWDLRNSTIINNGITAGHYDVAASNARYVTYAFNRIGSIFASPTETGADSITGIIEMREGGNQNVGQTINSLTLGRSSITYDFPYQLVMGPPGAYGTNNPAWFSQEENTATTVHIRNGIALGNTSAEAGLNLSVGPSGNSASIFFAATPEDFANSILQNAGLIQLGSDSDKLVNYLSTANQKAQWYLNDGSTVKKTLELANTNATFLGPVTAYSFASTAGYGDLYGTGLRTAFYGTNAAYTLTSADQVAAFDTSGGAITATLPAAASNGGRRYTILNAASSTTTNVLTLDANASETISGGLTQYIFGGGSLDIQSDGTNWYALPLRYSVSLVKASNQDVTSNNTTQVDATELIVPILANRNYKFKAVLKISFAGNNPGIALRMQGPSSPTSVFVGGYRVNTSATVGGFVTVSAFNSQLLSGLTGQALDHIFIIEGTVRNGANAGYIRPSFCQNTSDSQAVTMAAGSRFDVELMP